MRFWCVVIIHFYTGHKDREDSTNIALVIAEAGGREIGRDLLRRTAVVAYVNWKLAVDLSWQWTLAGSGPYGSGPVGRDT